MNLKELLSKKKSNEDQVISSNIKVDYSSKKINLLPQNYYKLKRKRLSFTIIIILFFLVSTYFSYYLYQVKTYTKWYESQIYSIEQLDGFSGLNEQISKLTEEKNSQNLIFDLKKRIDSKSKLLVDIEKNNKSILYTLTTIEKELPSGITFSNVQVDSESSISINGEATNNKDIAVLIHNLKKTNYFKDVFVANITYQENVSVDNPSSINYTFSITCEFGGADNEIN